MKFSLRESFSRIPDLRHKRVFNFVMLGLLGIAVGFVSLLLGTGIQQAMPNPQLPVFGLPMFWLYFESPATIILNLLPPIILIFLVYFISGRAWVAFSLPSAFILLLSASHFIKMQVRGDPLFASDLAFIREAGAVGGIGIMALNWRIYVAIFAFALGTAFCVIVLKRRLLRKRIRIIGAVAALAVSLTLYTTVYTNAGLYESITGGYNWTQWSTSLNYVVKGFLYPFIHSIQYAQSDRVKPPEGYDSEEARTLLESYGSTPIPDDEKVSIITVMLEAYSDLSLVFDLDLTEEIYEPLHRLQAESVNGYIICNTLGGGTIDSERLFLTGNTELTGFKSPSGSFVHLLNSLGYHTEGYTASTGWFYDRRAVNRYLGFDAYYFRENLDNSNQSDAFFFGTVRALYDERDRSKPYFSFSVSGQNHGPYPHWRTEEPYMLRQGAMSSESFNILNNYLTGILDTTMRLEGFIDSFRQDPDPVVILVFADHMPWLGSFEAVYLELGVEIDISAQEGFYNLYSTPYLIWANDAAKEVFGSSFTGVGGSFSPGFLMGELFAHLSWEGDGYMKALRELRGYTDIVNTPTGLFRENGELTADLSPQAAFAYNRLKKMEYYRMSSFD